MFLRTLAVALVAAIFCSCTAHAQSPTESAWRTLVPSAWVEVCTTPCRVSSVSTGGARLSVTSAVPGQEDAPAVVLTQSEPSRDFGIVGLKVYGRALNGSVRVVVEPYGDGSAAGTIATVRPMPFVRATRSPFVLPATTTPAQYLITQPVGADTYRGYNPCVQADVRIMSVAALEPIATQATSYPGVSRVTSQTEVIDRLSGVRFGRGPETLGSATNPQGGQGRIVSIMLVPVPGYPADLSGVTCEFELLYGSGS